ncbi:MAG: penicillin acylase family protein, partial [Planctomycetes bacterium]|nr:penicillin acylase family protein [Planctomycetota bacterium]
MLWIQYACKAARGELSWVVGVDRGLQNDLAVRALHAHLGEWNLTEAELQALFAPSGTIPIAANFWDNCVAYAAGANAYREEVLNSTGTQTSEGALHDWLDNNALPWTAAYHHLQWVYLDPIDPLDIASQGAWTGAHWSFLRPWLSLVNSNGFGYTDDNAPQPGVDPTLVEDPLAPGTALRQLEQLREHAAGVGGLPAAMSGSNSFGWSGYYCEDPVTGTKYSGLVGDPHHALPFASPLFTVGFGLVPNHMWYAHVKVTPPGATEPTLDVFGQVPHGSATFLSLHNRNLAVGGTASQANVTDQFVLRLREDVVAGTGLPVTPYEFYSYYDDDPLAPTNDTFRAVWTDTADIRRPDDTVVSLPYWRADSFGLVLPDYQAAVDYVTGYPSAPAPTMPILYGERVEPTLSPPRWRVDVKNPTPKMRYWASPQQDNTGRLITSPMVVALRAPMDKHVAGDPKVAGEDRHWLLSRDFWEIAHASTVWEVKPRTNAGNYPVIICCTNRDGQTFTAQLGAIPRRGDDAAIAADQYSSIDKFSFYNLSSGPVPARHYEDRKFDWQFQSYIDPSRPGPLQYLDYPGGSPITITGPFKAMTLQIPNPGPTTFPPFGYSGTGPTFKITSGLFAGACNDNAWGFSRRRDEFGWLTTPTGPLGFNNIATDNWLFNQVLDYGVGYQTTGFGLEAPPNQQLVVEWFTRRAVSLVPTDPTPPIPAMTPAEMRQFVVTPKLLSAPDYVPPPSVVA